MIRYRSWNMMMALVFMLSFVFGGTAQGQEQVPLPGPEAQIVQRGMPVVNDELGMTNGSSQMRSTTAAMRIAAAYNQAQSHKAVSQTYAGLDSATKALSPLAEKGADLATMAAPLSPPDYFGVANWANSQLPQLDATGAVIPGTGIRKFVDTLPGLCGVSAANSLGQCIPVGIPDTTTFAATANFPGSDYYEIGLVEYRERMHPDLPATGTEIRGYVQIVPSNYPGAVALTVANGLTMDIKDRQGNQVYGATKPHYMGPLILAQGCELNSPGCTPRPVRVKFTNYLPTGPAGDLFIPVDPTYMGAGMGPGGSLKAVNVTSSGAGYTSAPTVVFNNSGTGGTGAVAVANVSNGVLLSILITNGGSGYNTPPAVTLSGGGATTQATATAVLAGLPGEMYTENRATLHLHGGNTPWISDGTPHQWTTPYGEATSYSKGASVSYVPDMWFDANGNLISSCAGLNTCSVAGASNDPGLGSLSFYWTNQESGRLLFYHDHAYGITRLNVYAGEAAGYLIVDPAEESALAAANFPGTIPDIYNLGTADLAHFIPLIIQDKTFVPDNGVQGGQLAATDPTWDVTKYGGAGNMWLPHVWMPNQNPADVTGANAYGRWDYGPWFWPPQDPSTFVAGGLPYPCGSAAYPPGSPPAFPPLMCPGIPNPSGVMEGMMDTPIINGAAYPTLTVDPTAYRIQILSVGNDRAFNLGFYQAEPLSVALTNGGSGYATAPLVSFTGGGGSGASAVAKMSNGSVTSIILTGVGHGYTAAPNVTITGNGSGATATAVVDPVTTTILQVRIGNPGAGYTSATVTIDPPLGCTTGCLTATAVATVTPPGVVLGIDVTNPGSGWTSAPTVALTGGGGTGASAIASINSEVKMVDAVPHSPSSSLPLCAEATQTSGGMLALASLDASGNPVNGTGLPAACWPTTWPTDGRDGGVPDPLSAGPPFIQIGSESGVLPSPVVIPSTPVGYEYNRKSITVLNVFTHGLLLGPAERAEVVVDFSQFAGKTLLLYNDSPAPVPAFDPRNDYYTGDPDQTDSGGAPTTLPGYGPNTRTLMQIKVNAVPAGSNSSLSSVSVTSHGSGYTAPSVSITGGGGSGAAATATGSVTGLTLTNAGTGYTNPVISFSGGGGSGASAVFASGAVSGLTLSANGAGYASMPAVSFSGGGGTLAAATASGSVDAVNLTAGGAGYASTAVTLTGGGGSGATASATGAVNLIAITSGGGGYAAMPTISFTGGGGSGAAAAATGSVDAVAVTGSGGGYTSMPTVSFTGGGGAGASANATGSVDAINLTTPGAGYTAPSVSIPGGATATASGAVDNVLLVSGGTGYTAPTVSLTGGGGTGATASATVAGGVITGISFTGGSGYTSAPAVVITDVGPGSGATATATQTGGVITAITPGTPGSGYLNPVVTVTDSGGPGAGAVVTAQVSGGAISGYTIVNGGAGYVNPVLVITDAGTGAGASATATISVSTINLTAGGLGYTAAPAVTISDSGTPTTAAAANATLLVSAINLTAPGSGYTAAPTVSFSSGTAAATATLTITAISVSAAGAGYTSAPTVVFSSGAASAVATLRIDTLSLLTGGAGYISAPLVSFTGGGTGAAATATLMVSALTVTSPGSGYTSAPLVSFSGGGGTGAAATATIASTGISLVSGGSGYTSAPLVTITDTAPGTGSGATATATLSINGVTLTNPGSGYTSAPLVSIADTGGGLGTGASAVASLSGNTAFNLAQLQTLLPTIFETVQNKMTVKEPAFPAGNGGASQPTYVRIEDTSLPGWIGGPVQGITLVNSGSGYTSAPSLSITGGGGTGATASVMFAGAVVNNLTLTNPGAGYTSAPTVVFNNTGTGGTGAAATATFTRIVNSILITNGGAGYTSPPAVTIAAPPPGGTQATAVSSITGGVVTAITITNPGSGYGTTAPNVSIALPPTGGGPNRATATATVTGVVQSLLITNGGSGYASAPAVSFTGGGTPTTPAAATATILPGTVTGVLLTNGGSGYTSAPTLTFTGGGTPSVPAQAVATTPVNPLVPKAIQELFTLDYGRMNATLGVELPFTNFFTQTTIPYGYIDPPTEMFKSGDIQLWKITHNGVDTHLIHFHLFDVQVINRVGWDGMIKPPDANEVGWKDTVRMNPLEDIIVALRPMKQRLPFELPNSVRTMDVTEPIGASNANNTPGFANIDLANQPATVTNDLVNFGWEYVWHCHILSHEEIDMMRPMSMAVPPDAPDSVTATLLGPVGNQYVVVRWRDLSINETGFSVQQSISLNGPWITLTPTAPAAPGTGTYLTFTDTTVNRRTSYYYRVVANNEVGYTATYAAPAVGYPHISADSTPVNAAAPITTQVLNPNADAPIFGDSFETWFSAWSGSIGDPQIAEKSLLGSGERVMAVALGDGTQAGDPSYVYDLSPNDEARYDANFYFDPNGASTNGQPVDIFTGLDQQGQPIFGIQYQAAGATSYQLRAWSLIHGARSFTPWYTVLPESEPEDDPLSSVHKLDVAWQSAARGGGLSLYIDDLHFATLSGDTLAYKLNEILLGAVDGLSSGASGTVYFDEFTSSQVSGMQYPIFLPMVGH